MTQSETPTTPEVRPLSLEDFREDAHALDDGTFAVRHGRAFFLHHGVLGDLQPARRGRPTLLIDGEPSDLGSVRPDFLVFPIRAAGRAGAGSFVSIGRTDSNDIIINDVSVSKFHAFCRVTPEGAVAILDSGSSNGTYVNGIAVPKHGGGEPVHLSPGDSVRLGSVRLSFLPLAPFRRMLLDLDR